MIIIITTKGHGIAGTRMQWICTHCHQVVAQHCTPKGEPGMYERLNPTVGTRSTTSNASRRRSGTSGCAGRQGNVDYDLVRYYANGWRWTLTNGRCFRTDGEGRGLWVWSADNGDWVTARPALPSPFRQTARPRWRCCRKPG